MNAIIEVAPRGSVFHTAQQQFAESRSGKTPDFRLSLESARTLCANLTPARLELLDTLRRIGPCTPATLARIVASTVPDVQTDIASLEFLGLVERDEAGDLTVPYESVEIILALIVLVPEPGGRIEVDSEEPDIPGIRGTPRLPA